MNNVLAGYTALAHSATIYVPTTKGTSGAIDAAELRINLDFVAEGMAQEFGGFTITEGTGGWHSKVEGLVTEKVFMVRSNAETMTVEQTNRLVAIAKVIKRIQQQEAVSLEVDGKLYFI